MAEEKYRPKEAHVYFKDVVVKERISKLAEKEKRTFSGMLEILCEEALNARQTKKLTT